jgi:ABC-type spermidine/putrescine transport system permease subunit II
MGNSVLIALAVAVITLVIATSAAFIFNDHILTKDSSHLLRQNSSENICSAASSKRNN